MRRRRRAIETVVGLAGGALLTAGLLLPWTRANPTYHGPVPAVYLAGMRSGLQWTDYLFLGGIGVAVFCILTRRYATTANRVITATGGSAVLVVGIDTLSYFPTYAPAFVPARGTYLTIAGGLLLAVVGLTRPQTHQNDRRDDSSGVARLADK